MTSRFKMQIVDKVNNEIVEWEPGLSVEMEFVEDIVSKILLKGVGLFRTSKHVEQDIRNGLEEAFFSLKAKVKPMSQS